MQPYRFHRRDRVIHRLYGRGAVEAVALRAGQARVHFDGEPIDRRVLCADMVPEPREAPSLSRPPLALHIVPR